MNDKTATSAPGEGGRDYSKTLFLPRTDFPMRAGLPQKEPEILRRWAEMDIFARQREQARGRTKYVLHDGPPYANGNIHIGTGLNKILKDVVARSHQMLGFDSNYVPGWDCHGLPIEWKIEEQYRARGRSKDAVPINEFRRECRDFARHWMAVQADEFVRLGVNGNFADPYTTMSRPAEATIAAELLKFAMSGQLYRGSKPVMWSVVEKTALAEAEVEYHDHTSDTIWVKFPVTSGPRTLRGASVVIWTTTPWTIPGNRAVAYSPRIPYGLYEVTAAPDGNWAAIGDRYVLADALAAEVMAQGRVEAFERRGDVPASDFATLVCAHPLRAAGLGGYGFDVPLLPGEHVTAETGTGFVHTAPGHGREDFEVWMEHRRELDESGVDTTIPYTVDADGALTADAPGFEGRRVITDKGEKGDANETVIRALADAGKLVARGRLKHQYPHSWRSKKPVIFRNTPQWFIHMDRDIDGADDTLRARALRAIADTRFVPAAGQNRMRGHDREPSGLGGVAAARLGRADRRLRGARDRRRTASTRPSTPASSRSSAPRAPTPGSPTAPRSASSKASSTTPRNGRRSTTSSTCGSIPAPPTPSCWRRGPTLKWPADLYLEGSDQHRGWFHSSLLESCGTRGRAPYDAVLTHGFVMAEDGRKMSKSLGNQVFPQDVIKQSGADILRLWVATSDYSEDLRIGPEILKTVVDSYRKLRNTVRWMLGSLAHVRPEYAVADADMPELERLMMSELARLDPLVRDGYAAFDFKRVCFALLNFMTGDLSAFYFDIRKDTLYCEPQSSPARHAALTMVDRLFDALVKWLAPMLPFTCEEAWTALHGEDGSVHLELFPDIPAAWRDTALEAKWDRIRDVRRVVTGALEIERREKRIGSSLEAAPRIFVADPELLQLLETVDMSEVSITSQAHLHAGDGPADAFRLAELPGIAVEPALAEGRKCARSWKILPTIGSDPDYPDLSPRDAAAMREFDAAREAAE